MLTKLSNVKRDQGRDRGVRRDHRDGGELPGRQQRDRGEGRLEPAAIRGGVRQGGLVGEGRQFVFLGEQSR